MNILQKKLDFLKEILASYESAAIAFSGGVDSSFLLAAAHEVLGDKAVAVTAVSGLVTADEAESAAEFCRQRSIPQIVFERDIFSDEALVKNPPDRCYICKSAMLDRLQEIAAENGLKVIAEGSNADDDGDYRPGMKAVREHGVRSPLRDAGLTKAEIRQLSRDMGLDTWDKPSAACLASRIPYGEIITAEKLEMIAKAEGCLKSLGFSQLRVRLHGSLARIEISPDEFSRLLEKREQINDCFTGLGFLYVTMDISGFHSGSLNKAIKHL